MRSILELLSKYRSEVVVIPMIALGALILTLFIYLFLNKWRWVKYVPGLVTVIVGIIFMYQGYYELLRPVGLDLIEMATKLLVFGFTVIGFSVIFDIFSSYGESIRSLFTKDKNKKVKQNKKVKRGLLDNVKAKKNKVALANSFKLRTDKSTKVERPTEEINYQDIISKKKSK